MNTKSFFYATLLVFGTVLILGSAGCSKAPQVATTAAAKNVDYWTCTMHPSVHSKTPGKCPICSMDLVPVMKKGAGSPAASPGEQVVSNARSDSMSATPVSGELAAPPKPTEFTVPVERQQQIGVTYTEVKRRPCGITSAQSACWSPIRPRCSSTSRGLMDTSNNSRSPRRASGSEPGNR